jgi:hypothetical protein
MAYQFRPSHNDRSYSRGHPDNVSSSSPLYQSQHWQTQQCLLMGSNTPIYHRPISVSPQASYTVSNFDSVTPIIQAQPNYTSTPPSSSGRVMYPSSTYTYGDLGYYDDSLQFPVSHDTQTGPHLYTLHQNTYVPIRNN